MVPSAGMVPPFAARCCHISPFNVDLPMIPPENSRNHHAVPLPHSAPARCCLLPCATTRSSSEILSTSPEHLQFPLAHISKPLAQVSKSVLKSLLLIYAYFLFDQCAAGLFSWFTLRVRLLCTSVTSIRLFGFRARVGGESIQLLRSTAVASVTPAAIGQFGSPEFLAQHFWVTWLQHGCDMLQQPCGLRSILAKVLANGSHFHICHTNLFTIFVVLRSG